MQQILAQEITDYGIVDLIARNIQKLPEDTQKTLKLAACIGNRFNLYVLAVASEKSASETATFLWNALQAGLVLPLSESYKIPLVGAVDWEQNNYSLQIGYKFLHDRVQQAAYSLIPEDEKRATHLKIGQLVLANTPEAQIEQNVFDIVNQLNIGREFIQSQAEKNKLAELNLLVGKKAKDSTAYDAALKYLNISLELLEENSWETQYQLTLDIHIEAVAAEYLNTNFERANQLSELVFERAKSLIEKIPVYETKIQFFISQNQMQEIIDTVIPLLEILKFPLPKKVNQLVILAEILRTKIKLGRKSIDQLATLPLMKDPYKLATMRLLNTVFVAAGIANPLLVPVVAMRMISFSLKYGNCPQTAIGYVLYGLILCSEIGDINSGYKFGQLAIKLIKDFDFKPLIPAVSFFFHHSISHWKENAKHQLNPLLEMITAAIDAGNIEYAAYSGLGYLYYAFLNGSNLEYLAEKNPVDIIFLKLKNEFYFVFGYGCKQAIFKLLDRNLKLEQYGSESLLSSKENDNVALIFYANLCNCIFAYLMRNYHEAVQSAKLAEKYSKSVFGGFPFAVHNFYYSLALLGIYSEASNIDKKKLIKKVNANQKKHKKWANYAPINYQRQHDLVEAEKARVLGQDYQAITYYEQAIAGANKEGYIHEEALACELAAEFHFSRNRAIIAKAYLLKSYYAYIQWGALAKVKDLEKRYPEIFSEVLKREAVTFDFTATTPASFTLTSNTAAGSSNMLDMLSVMKASQAISGELVLEKLFSNLMKILMENAGAITGFLLLKKADKLIPVASGKLENKQIFLLPSDYSLSLEDLPLSLVNYVERTLETVILNNASQEGFFVNDPYIVKHQSKSALGMPIIYQSRLIGVLYLENNLAIGAFPKPRLEVLKTLTSQAAISLDNATLYHDLQESAVELEDSLHKLQQTQAQLVQTEKISSLGQLVAGVAHEVNNPVSFISGNLHHAKEYVDALMKHIKLYQKYLPNPPAEIQASEEDIELDYLIQDLPKILSSMKLGTDRIREIMQSLRNFSRLDSTEKKPANIHTGIDSTLMILQHRLKPRGELAEINVVKEYGDLPEIACYAGSLNQVFMNILANSIDAMEELRVKQKKTITIKTEQIDSDTVTIRIKDDGPGMTEKVRQQLFNAFFTTKPEGKGTGLGLSISYQIVVEKHGGKLECVSAPGQGAEFIITIPID
jgi:signal transduction histidine kinase